MTCPPSKVRILGLVTDTVPFPDPAAPSGCVDICAGMPIAKTVNGTPDFNEEAYAPGATAGASYALKITQFATDFIGVALDEIACTQCEKAPACLQYAVPDAKFRMDVEFATAETFDAGDYVTLAEDPDNAGDIAPNLYEITANAPDALFRVVAPSGPTGVLTATVKGV